MATSTSQLAKCLRQIRKTEQLTQQRFAEMVGIAGQSVKHYESGYRGVGAETLLKVTNHDRFKRYTLWLMTGETAHSIGQIKPYPF